MVTHVVVDNDRISSVKALSSFPSSEGKLLSCRQLIVIDNCMADHFFLPVGMNCSIVDNYHNCVVSGQWISPPPKKMANRRWQKNSCMEII